MKTKNLDKVKVSSFANGIILIFVKEHEMDDLN